MAFVPASSIPSGSVTVVGTVSADVTDRVARLLGHVTVDNASLAVTGPLTSAELAALEPLSVTGPLTSAQLVGLEPLGVNVSNFPAVQTVDVDNFPATQAVSVAALPLPDGAATEDTLESVRGAANDSALTAILQRERMETE